MRACGVFITVVCVQETICEMDCVLESRKCIRNACILLGHGFESG